MEVSQTITTTVTLLHGKSTPTDLTPSIVEVIGKPLFSSNASENTLGNLNCSGETTGFGKTLRKWGNLSTKTLLTQQNQCTMNKQWMQLKGNSLQ